MSKSLLGYLFILLSAVLPIDTAVGKPATAIRAEVFALRAEPASDGGIRLLWTIAPNTYLYRDKIGVRTADHVAVPVTTIAGLLKEDPTFGPTEIYHDRAEADIAASASTADGMMIVTYQGCAERGICYPPVSKAIDLKTMAVTDAITLDGGERDKLASASSDSETPQVTRAVPMAEFALRKGSLAFMLGAFFLFGLLLAFTPCVFPMIPVLSGLLARSGETLTMRRGLVTSLAYVLAMATAYATLGLAAAWSGQNLQVALQTPFALGVTCLVFVVLALSMFGVYDMPLTALIRPRTSVGTSRLGIADAALLGFGSALIVGPCVTPPLAAALLYVIQDGSLARGASALFAFGLGMGAPLLIFGTFGAGWLPKSGPWLIRAKHAFGFVFLGMAVWMLSRVVPAWLTLELSGAWLAGLGLYLGGGSFISKPFWQSRSAGWKFSGAVAVLWGGILMLGSFVDTGILPFGPQAWWQTPIADGTALEFRTATSPASLRAAIESLRTSRKPVVLDFSAAWCVECARIDRVVFADAAVRKNLQDVTIIKVDLTRSDDDSRSLMRRFGVAGPPTMIFLDASTGAEVPDLRTVGPIDATSFIEKLARLKDERNS